MPEHLWQERTRANLRSAEPLATRMRPTCLDEFLGQDHLLGPGKLLRRMLQADRLTSMIFYGPPGTGKTTLARVIAHHTRRRFESADAAAVGVRQVRQVIQEAAGRLENDRTGTVFFLDEIHRFSRAQQDVLLKDVERGIVTLIGATTENPFFAVNAPLVSRAQIFQFQPLGEHHIAAVLHRALHDPDRGYGKLDIRITDDAIEHWVRMCDGDARRALTALEIAVLSGGQSASSDPDQPEPDPQPTHEPVPSTPTPSTAPDNTQPDNPSTPAIVIDLTVAEQSIQRKAIVYDPTGDGHYDAASALIKSMRGSDPDAAVYWLACMLEAGEDPRFIARRIAILASEDIGNADPRAIAVASAAFDIVERIGMPEANLTLAQAVIYMATAPKSNASAQAIWSAAKDVKLGRTIPVPRHLRDGHYRGAKKLGNAQGYQYAHDSPTGYVSQDYLGVDKTYYTPTQRGYEQQVSRYLHGLREQNARHAPPSPTDGVSTPSKPQG